MSTGSIFHRSLVAHLVAVLLVTVLVAGSVFLSLRRSVDIWNVNRGQRLENLILPIVADIYRRYGHLDSDLIHTQLRHILTANVYAYVFDRDRRPVYIYSVGRRTLLYDRTAVSRDLARLGDTGALLTPIVDGGEVVGYLSADTVGFTHDAANRRFLMSLTGTVLTGAAAAVLVALTASWWFATQLAREARAVADGLRRISTGRRDVTFADMHATELREISDSANSLQNQLGHEERLRRQWMEDIAHDLRTPVAALKSQIEGMSEGYLSNDAKRLKRLHDEVEHVEWLVSGLRELSQIESPETEVVYESLDICEFISGVVATLARPDVETDSRTRPVVRVHCPGPLYVRFAPHLLRRALENVVANAVQNLQLPGSVDVTVEDRADRCTIDVANTGTVDPEEIPRFFDRLYRSDRSARRGGSGLGLPIARSAVERHGGTIAMHQEGHTTHVRIDLPVQTHRV
jgi:two-component system, OmpR family, sensor histidine kinase BaeS